MIREHPPCIRIISGGGGVAWALSQAKMTCLDKGMSVFWEKVANFSDDADLGKSGAKYERFG